MMADRALFFSRIIFPQIWTTRRNLCPAFECEYSNIWSQISSASSPLVSQFLSFSSLILTQWVIPICEPQPTRAPFPTLSGLRSDQPFVYESLFRRDERFFSVCFFFSVSALCSVHLLCALLLYGGRGPHLCFLCNVWPSQNGGRFREWNLVLRYWQRLCFGRPILLDSSFFPLRVSSLCVQLCSIAFSNFVMILHNRFQIRSECSI